MSRLPFIKNATARAVFLDRHALVEPPSGSGQGADLQAVIDGLGFVQVDSINTVSRAHHMILHARRTSYREPRLARLHDRDRGVFEHWTHDASMIAMQFYPHWRLKFRRDEAKLDKQWRLWRRDGFHDKLDDVLATGAKILVSTDLGCLLHLAGRAETRGETLRLFHIAEVLADELDAPAIGETP